MDIKLGKLNLTREQLERSSSLKSELFKGLSQDSEGNVTVVCGRELTDKETEKLQDAISKLSKDPIPKSQKEQRLEELKGKATLTLSEITEILKARGLI